MNVVLKRSPDPSRQDLDNLCAFAPQDVLKTLLSGLTDGLSAILPDRIALPDEVRRELLSRWRDPKSQDNLRKAIQMIVAAALRQEIPGALADPMAIYLTDAVFYPAVKSSGDLLLDKMCNPNASVEQTSKP